VDGAVLEQFPVSGAQLYTETRGTGPLLLFVVGGNGDPAVFSRVAGRLAGDFTVVTYARRGLPVVRSTARSTTRTGSPPTSRTRWR
jgi:acetyltransferase/esterase